MNTIQESILKTQSIIEKNKIIELKKSIKYANKQIELELKKINLPKKENKNTKITPKTYLMKNRRNGLYKIGKSVNPIHRETTLQSEEPSISLVKIFDYDIEKDLHNQFRHVRVRGEWFKLTKTHVAKICKLKEL